LQMQQATHTATQRQCHDEILSRRRSTRRPDAEQGGSTLVVSRTDCCGNGIPPKINRNRYAFLNAVRASTYLFEGRPRHVEASRFMQRSLALAGVAWHSSSAAGCWHSRLRRSLDWRQCAGGDNRDDPRTSQGDHQL
jgi:hypothetical protein